MKSSANKVKPMYFYSIQKGSRTVCLFIYSFVCLNLCSDVLFIYSVVCHFHCLSLSLVYRFRFEKQNDYRLVLLSKRTPFRDAGWTELIVNTNKGNFYWFFFSFFFFFHSHLYRYIYKLTFTLCLFKSVRCWLWCSFRFLFD